MKVQFDRDNDSLYFRLNASKIEDSSEVAPGVILDFDLAGSVVGFELLQVSRRTPEVDLKKMEYELV